MDIKYLLPKGGQFYKANLHAHTTVSDGKLTPLELKDFYKSNGYSVVAFTDHDKLINHTELNDAEFLAVSSFEVGIGAESKDEFGWDRVSCYHLNFYDTKPNENLEFKKNISLPQRKYDDIDYINSYIKMMGENGFICCYNHPYWSLQTLDDYRNIRGCFAMEIYNHGCEIDGLYGGNPQVYDEMLRTGNKLFCVATDDNHNSKPHDSLMSDSFGGFVEIKSPSLGYNDIMQALIDGNFYSSTGPKLESIWIEGNKLVVESSPVEKIYVITQGRFCHQAVAKPNETITRAEFELTGKEGYIRVDCRDSKGFHAYSNAYFL